MSSGEGSPAGEEARRGEDEGHGDLGPRTGGQRERGRRGFLEDDAAGVVAMLAGITVEPLKPELRHFPATMRDAGGWRRTMAEQGIDDLAAVMEPGIAALLSVHARGINPKIPAQALWQEYLAARNGLMALVPPPGEALAPRRFT